MLLKSNVIKSSGRFVQYNFLWEPHTVPASMELHMITRGGRFKKQNGDMAGEGLAYHYRKFQELVWPGYLWEKGPFKNYWAEKCLEAYLAGVRVGVLGCSGAGKSMSFGMLGLTDWYSHPSSTTVLVSSTDLTSLDLRIWGFIKGLHKEARAAHDWIPGHLIEGKRTIINDAKDEFTEGRDFKNGIIGVPTKKGNQNVGLGPLIGIHNKRVILLADEGQLMPRGFLDATANLAQNPFFKLVCLGNPNETTNAHGIVCEPAVELGGWEGGIDQRPGTKIWKTRLPDGVALQLPASDSPNLKATDGSRPFEFLPDAKSIADSAAQWGIDDWHHLMFIEARMPRGQGSRRVLTRQMCKKFGAFEPPNWRDSRIVKIGFLDAAYRGVGGDRCVFGELWFGYETDTSLVLAPEVLTPFTDQTKRSMGGKQIIALIDLTIIPISEDTGADTPEDQIVAFVQQALQNRGIEPGNFFYDAGMRTSLVMAFSRAGMQWSESIDFGASPSEEMVSTQIQQRCCDYYQKFVTELWFRVRHIVESGQLRGLTEDCCTEFSQREWKMTTSNKIVVETKSEMKAKSSRSPDLADAVAIGCHGAVKRGFRIDKLGVEKYEARNDEWKNELRKKAVTLRQNNSLTYA